MYGAENLVLVGDHKQLGPCVSQEAEARGLGLPLFERLIKVRCGTAVGYCHSVSVLACARLMLC